MTEPRGGRPYNTYYRDHIIYVTGECALALVAWLLKHPQQGVRHQELVSQRREPRVWGRRVLLLRGGSSRTLQGLHYTLQRLHYIRDHQHW